MTTTVAAGRFSPSTATWALFSCERLPWALLGLTLGLVEGATVAVFIKHAYSGGRGR